MYLEDARKQHYYFVHRYLRDKVATSPALAVRDLEDEKSIQYLKAMWARIALESINFNEELIPPDGLEIHLFNIGETHRAVIVKFPEPKGPPEAFMVAIVIPVVHEVRGCDHRQLRRPSDGIETQPVPGVVARVVERQLVRA